METHKSNIWFALDKVGYLWCLGDCGDFEAAKQSALDMCVDAIWIIDERQAREWQERLNNNLDA